MIELFGTLGPACRDPEILTQMFREGMTGMRLNLSHSGLIESEAMIRDFQTAAEAAGAAAELLIDLQGPELRIGTLERPLTLKTESTIPLSSLPLPACVADLLEPNDRILLDDGKLELQRISDSFQVIRGGTLLSRKSIKIIGKDVPMPALTEADKANLAAARAFGVSAVMQPFVRSERDLIALKEELRRNHA